MGYYDTVLLASDGSVYVSGDNGGGQLDLGDYGIRRTFIRVLLEVPVVAVSTGIWHTVLLAVNGSVYVSGHNNYAQLGLGDLKHRKTFTRVPLKVPVRGKTDWQAFTRVSLNKPVIGVRLQIHSSTFRFADGTVRQNG